MPLKNITIIVACLCFMSSAHIADAHVVVKPNQVGIGSFQTFTIGVPVEQQTATVGLRLVLPEGLQYVSPNVKPGWTITTKKSGQGDTTTVTEIDWTGGSIPVGERDDFMFSAQVPTSVTSLQWKAYQTYANGTVVSWDHNPNEQLTSFATSGPYSLTSVINDLSDTPKSGSRDTSALIISIVALVIALTAVRNSRQRV